MLLREVLRLVLKEVSVFFWELRQVSFGSFSGADSEELSWETADIA